MFGKTFLLTNSRQRASYIETSESPKLLDWEIEIDWNNHAGETL